MVERIKIFIKSLAITERAFSIKCGIAQNTMSYYLSGQRKLSLEAVKKILDTYPELSAEWVMRGEGAMLKAEPSDANLDRVLKLVDTVNTLQDALNEKSKTIATLKERIAQLENQLKTK